MMSTAIRFKQHTVLLGMFWYSLFVTLSAQWIVDLIPIPFYSLFVTACLYLPMAACAAWKLYWDLKELRQKKNLVLHGLYYGFALYFLLLTAFRFLTHAPWQESVYYFVRLYGALSFADLIRRFKISRHALRTDLSLFAVFLCVYRLLYVIVKKQIKYNVMPINEIAMGAVLLFALIAAADLLCHADKTRTRLLAAGAILGTVIVLMTLTSRIIFAGLLLAGLCLLVQFILDKSRRKHIKSLIALFLCGAVVVCALAVMNVGNVRYALYRATGISQTTALWGGNQAEPPATEPGEPTEPEDKDESQIAAESQITRSDALRTRLMKFGIAEAKKNILFGTGNVYMEIEDPGYLSRAPVHNGILQMLVAFGLLGMLLLLGMMGVWFWKGIPRPLRLTNGKLIGLLLTVGLYCMLGMVQATCFDLLVLPVVLVGTAVFMDPNVKGTAYGK